MLIVEAAHSYHAPSPTSFVDRGDPLNPDYTLGDLVTNAAWHDLALAAIVAAGATAVLLRVTADGPGPENQIYFRRDGNVNDANVARVFTQVAGITNDVNLVVPLDVARTIEYRADNVAWNAITITVRGWWR